MIPLFPSPGRPIEARFGMQAAFALAAQASRIAVSRCARPGGSHSLRTKFTGAISWQRPGGCLQQSLYEAAFRPCLQFLRYIVLWKFMAHFRRRAKAALNGFKAAFSCGEGKLSGLGQDSCGGCALRLQLRRLLLEGGDQRVGRLRGPHFVFGDNGGRIDCLAINPSVGIVVRPERGTFQRNSGKRSA